MQGSFSAIIRYTLADLPMQRPHVLSEPCTAFMMLCHRSQDVRATEVDKVTRQPAGRFPSMIHSLHAKPIPAIAGRFVFLLPPR